MDKHKYRPFTTRDGSKACAECNGNEYAEQHVMRGEFAASIPEHLKLDMEKTLRLAKRLEAAEALLKRAYNGMHKEHWQEGESERECCDAIETYFFNVVGSKPVVG